MRPPVSRGGFLVLAAALVAATRCASSANSASTTAPPARVPSAAGVAQHAAAAHAVTGPMLAFSFELYEGIQRYEALAGATEEAGTSHGQVAPELAELEA